MRVAAIFNTDEVGGAERSLLIQLKFLKDTATDLYIPCLKTGNIKSSLEELAEDSELGRVCRFKIPLGYYRLSRSGMILSFLRFLVSLPVFILRIFQYRFVTSYDVVYLNGNKVGCLFALACHLFRFRGKLVWHFRDYPTKNLLGRLMMAPLRLQSTFQKELVFNSTSVGNEYKKELYGVIYRDHVIYNPSGVDGANGRQISQVKCIGIVAMMASWKGIHQAILWWAMYRDQLAEIGVEKLKVFGGDIYRTSGKHSSYHRELESLISKLGLQSSVEMIGNSTPCEIFSQIDILIHAAIMPEPFGRVIAEAFAYKVPVVSTALGGAAELVKNGHSGHIFAPYDYAGLYLRVKKLVLGHNTRKEICDNGFDFLQKIEQEIPVKMNNVLR